MCAPLPPAVVVVALLIAAAACSSSVGDTIAPQTSLIAAASAVPSSTVFGERIPVSVIVTNADARPESGARVSFWASDQGVVDPIVMTDARGIAATTWTISDLAVQQTLTVTTDHATPISFTLSATNAWILKTDGWPAMTYRYADDVIPGTSASWTSTPLGSPPRLVISCQPLSDDPIGMLSVTLTHPKLSAAASTVTWTLDGRDPVTEGWDAPDGNSLRYPWGTFNTKALVRWIAAGMTFTVQFRDAATNTAYAATFGGAGLRITEPLATYDCEEHPTYD